MENITLWQGDRCGVSPHRSHQGSDGAPGQAENRGRVHQLQDGGEGEEACHRRSKQHGMYRVSYIVSKFWSPTDKKIGHEFR